MAESYSVEAFLKVNANDFTQGFEEAAGAAKGFEGVTENAGITVGKLVTALGLVTVAAKGFDLMRNSVEKAFARIDTMESFDRTMTAITGSSDDAAKALEQTSEAVTGTAYGLDVAAKSVQNFVTRGVDIGKATEYVAAWGDAVAFYGDGTNEQFSNVTDALGKMLSTNKVTMDQMDRLYDAGINATQMYADATGMSFSDVEKALSNGEINATEFVDVVTDAMMNGTGEVLKIAGAAKEAGNSWGNVFTNMQAAVTRGVISIIDSIDEMLTSNGLPEMRTMVAEFGSYFESALNWIADLIPSIVEHLKSVKAALDPWIPTIQSIILAISGFVVAYAILGTLLGLFSSIRTTLMAMNLPLMLVAALIAGIGYVVYDLWNTNEQFRNGMIQIWGQVQLAMQAALNILLGWLPIIIELLTALHESIKPWIPTILAATAAIGVMVATQTGIQILVTQFGRLKTAVLAINAPMLLAYAGIMALAAVIIYLWNTNEEFRTNVTIIWQNIQTLISTALTIVSGLLSTFGNFLIVVLNAMLPLLAMVVNLTAAFLQWGTTLLANNQWIIQLATVILIGVAAFRTMVIIIGVVRTVILALTAVYRGIIATLAIFKTSMAIATTASAVFGTTSTIAFAPVSVPLLLIIAVIAAVVAALVWAYTQFEWFRNMLSPIVDGLKSMWDGFLNVLGIGTKVATDDATNSINAMGENTGSATAEMSATNQSNISEMTSGMGFDMNSMSLGGIADFQSLNGGASAQTSAMMGNVTGDMSAMHAASSTEMSGLNTDVLSAFSSMNSGASLEALGMNSAVSNDASNMSSNVTSEIGNMTDVAMSDVGVMSGDVTGSVSEMSSAVTGDMSGLSSSLISQTGNMNNDVSSNFSLMNNNVTTEMSNIEKSTTDGMNNVGRGFNSSLADMVRTTNSQLKAMVSATRLGMDQLNSAYASGLIRSNQILTNGLSRIISTIRNYERSMNSSGAYLMQGFANGINSRGSYAINRANRIANQVAATMRRALDIHSPSRVTEEIGEYTGEGVGVGLDNMIRFVTRMSEKLAFAATPDLATVDIAGHVNNINRQATAQMQNNVSSHLSVEKQPANITFKLGNKDYTVFVDDITKTQQRTMGRQRNRNVGGANV